MSLLRLLLELFLYPGTLVLQKCGISIEDDGGLFRSFINMLVWGTVTLGVALLIL
ncbi:hypothetical protein [Mesorhizobium sp.]|uniref:hypothetical protein n=1 Tax=Mesorhizobium sp. TaxID=1871066 RepID=UPI00257B9DEA|nr:hypothetical protein [Mesorhizobium sp.]